MRSFTFVHTADCHLDTPFAGVGREDPALASRLRDVQRQVFDDLIHLCLDRKAAFLVIAGDLYDAAERSLTTRVRLREAFRRLEAGDVEVFFAAGNHDHWGDRLRGFDFPPNVHVFSPDQPETFLWPPDAPRAALTGISYGRPAIDANLALRFPPPAGDVFNVAVLHCNVDGDPAHDNYAPCRIDDLLRAGYDYWALGHVHERRILAGGPVTVVYSGCLQGRHVRETGEKGAVVVEVDAHGTTAVEFAPLDRFRWVEAEVDVSDAESDEELAERLRQRGAELVVGVPSRVHAIGVRWRLTGRLACDAAAVQRVLEMLRETPPDEGLLVWPESIDTRRTVAPVDLDELAAEATPRGDLVRAVRDLRNDPAALDEIRALLVDRTGPPEIAEELRQRREAQRLEEPMIEAILDEAVRLGVDRLSRPLE